MKHLHTFLLHALCGIAVICATSASASAAGKKGPAGTLEIIESEHLHCNDTVQIFSPAKLQAEKNLPTLILMHGYSGCWRDWGKNYDLQSLCDKTGWRIICPDGFYASWYFNNADSQKMQWRTFFWEEFYPLISQKYGLDPDKTFIAGLSMGGHGAMNLFLDHPECFKGAGSMSGVLDLRYTGGSKFLIPEILGKKELRHCDSESAVYRLENLARLGIPDARTKLLIVGCGTEDWLFGASKVFEARCKELGLNYLTFYREGKHNWKFWNYVLPYYIGWFSETL